MACRGSVSVVLYRRLRYIWESERVSFCGIGINYDADISAMNGVIENGADRKV